MSNAFDDEVARQAARMPAIRAQTIAEILRLLREAEGAIVARLANATESSTVKLRQQQAAVREAIDRFAAAADGRVHAALDESWRAGIELIGEPLTAIGVQLGPALRIDDRALRAMRNFTTGKIKDVALRTINAINSELAQVVIGTRPISEAITRVQKLLGGSTRLRAQGIVYTNVGMAYSQSSYDAMMAAEQNGVKLAKRWLKSGKMHPRPNHVAAHNQIVRASQPFMIGNPRTGVSEPLRFPRDPDASIENTIHCGCVMVPVLDGSTFGASVIEIPDDPRAPIRMVSPAQRAQSNRDQAARVEDRLARYLGRAP